MDHNSSEAERCESQRTAVEYSAGGKSRKPRMVPGLRFARAAIVICLVMLMGACATTFQRPGPVDDTAL
jgi:hypothetical protein